MKSMSYAFFTTLIVLTVLYHGYSQQPWVALTSGTSLQLNGVDFITADTGIVVGAQGLILKTTDGGVTWETVDAGVTANLNAVCFVSSARVIAVGNAGLVIRSDDGGDTWEVIPLGASIPLNGISIDRTSGKGLISGATLAMIWTNDFGENWVLGMGGFMSDFYKAFMTGGDFGVTFGVNSIFQPLLGYTDDAGVSFDQWNFYPRIGGVSYESTAVDGWFFSKEAGFVVGRVWNGQGFITQEINWSTHQWNSILVSGPLMAVAFGDMLSGVTVGGTANSMVFLETIDGGITWEDAVVNGNGMGFNDVVLTGQTGYAAGINGQIVKKQIPVGTDNLSDETIQWTVSPNPAHTVTVAAILLPEPQRIDLELCHLTGRIIRKLSPGELQSGSHSVPIDLGGLAPGFYLVKLFSGGNPPGVKKVAIL